MLRLFQIPNYMSLSLFAPWYPLEIGASLVVISLRLHHQNCEVPQHSLPASCSFCTLDGPKQDLSFINYNKSFHLWRVQISQTFAEMIFRHGFVHCDPHAANMMVRVKPGKSIIIVLIFLFLLCIFLATVIWFAFSNDDPWLFLISPPYFSKSLCISADVFLSEDV